MKNYTSNEVVHMTAKQFINEVKDRTFVFTLYSTNQDIEGLEVTARMLDIKLVENNTIYSFLVKIKNNRKDIEIPILNVSGLKYVC